MSLNSQQYADLAQDSYGSRQSHEKVTFNRVGYEVIEHTDRVPGTFCRLWASTRHALNS